MRVKPFFSSQLLVIAASSSRLGACRAFVAAPTAIRLRMGSHAAAANAASSLSTTLSSRPHDINLLPPPAVLDRVFEIDSRPIILFDGVCNMCNGAVNTAIDWDPRGKLRFSALQSNVGRALLQAHGREADDISSIVFVTPAGAYVKSDAILGISEELNPLPFLPLRPFAGLAKVVVPQFLRDLIYDGVADNRYSVMGKRDECRFDADGEFDDRFVDDELAES